MSVLRTILSYLDYPPQWVIISSVVLLCLGLAAAALEKWSERQEDKERQRLEATIYNPLGYGVPPGIGAPDVKNTWPLAGYDQKLINNYGLAHTQARTSFYVNMAFSVLGGLVLVAGVGLAIFQNDTGG